MHLNFNIFFLLLAVYTTAWAAVLPANPSHRALDSDVVEQLDKRTGGGLAAALQSVEIKGKEKGSYGSAFPTTYDNKRAWVKVLKVDKLTTLPMIENEVRCLVAVEQFYAWGHNGDTSDATREYYIAMPDLGIRTLKAQQDSAHPLPAKTPDQRTTDAMKMETEYKTKYGISHGDAHAGNLVWQWVPSKVPLKKGEWKPSLIDWGKAKPYNGKALPPLPEAQVVAFHFPAGSM
ncbi:hypothetical protein H0H92_004376 [Tricholoma furcatifolium]|nr:hypothetical protein H0H92_004376 [Tricholoma furcatifolium]